MSKESLRKQFGLTKETLSKEELEVLHLNDALLKRLSSIKGDKFGKSQEDSWMRDKLMAELGDRATANCEVIIDKVCLLSYPLNDLRTSSTLRQVYLEQEQLMIDLVAIEREEAKENDN